MRPNYRFFSGDPGKSYRPTNGEEGRAFDAMWCDCCRRDAVYRKTQNGDDGCPIIPLVMAHTENEPEYPGELVYGEDGQPKCTVFSDVDLPEKEEIDPRQLILFEVKDE